MSLPRGVMVYRIRGSFGVRVLGLASGTFNVDSVEGFVRRLAKTDAEVGTVTQAFNSLRVAGVEHLVHASRLAIIAFESGRGFASSLAIELICWVAAERQIYRAFEKMGVRSGRNDLALVSVGSSASQVRKAILKIFKDLGAIWDNSLMEMKSEKIPEIRRAFSIAREAELAPIQSIVLERIALLALEK
ncbi:MAG: KEOPS complex subunit Cgi121 [Candidatus Hadarchaeum sp.]|uniref:KEOPS complex subunit Cgi121 n=1 Tax=Candidatus Hadarchaeum sp. TaxID=2883567 RepID=UPI003177FC89